MNGFQMKWMDRKSMIERGHRMMAACNRGFIDDTQLHTWFERVLPRYASFGQSIFGQPTNMEVVERRFWNECQKWVVTQYYGYEWEAN